MPYSAVTLTALLLAAGASRPKWVPLGSVKAGSVDETKSAQAPVATRTPQAPDPSPAPAPTPVPQIAPTFASAAPAPAPVVTAVAGVQHPLQITCFGGGTANKYTFATGGGTTQINGMVGTTIVSGSAHTSTSVMIPREEGFSGQADLRLFDGNDRIRLPASIVARFHGGEAGWFKLKDVVADARSIHAKVLVNFLNHPEIYIDRVTGTISISGKSGDYSGECQVIDASAAPKF